ncbi:MAG: hypothetical protein HQ559_14820 [Lentisphaerae bacterium]|nr:hypothetical protein [Lentisphaerota bacterium]
MTNKTPFLLPACLAATLAASIATAEMTNIVAAKDNTLYEDETELSNGMGDYFFAGLTSFSELRRALVAFDVDSHVPMGSTVTGATLSLYMSKTISGLVTVGLHRVFADWGEGLSDAPLQEGGGSDAKEEDATWLRTFYRTNALENTNFWTTAGGDFDSKPSVEQSVTGTGVYSWVDEGLIADVQLWLDTPSSNFGWIVVSDEKKSPKRFDSKDNATTPLKPTLTIGYYLPPLTATTITNIASTGSVVTLGISGITAGASNIVRRAFNLMSNDWQDADTFIGGDGTTNWSESVDPGWQKAIYRIRSLR